MLEKWPIEAVPLRSWRTIILFSSAVILVGSLVGGFGSLTYQWFESSTSQEEQEIDSVEDGRYWAQQVSSRNGAFILYFRHAEREKWPLVAVYDYFEVSESVEGSEQSFAAAVCLSERGKEDARIIGRVFDTADIPVTRVLSSPSCRARETAELAFGRIDVTDRSIMSAKAVGVTLESELFSRGLLDLLMTNSPEDGERVAVVGHGDTLEDYSAEFFPGSTYETPKVNESGFYLIEVIDGTLVQRWAYVDFYDFARELLLY